MIKTILRKEHKNEWEKRTALTPQSILNLIESGYKVDVESSDIRIFKDALYQNNKANLKNSPNDHQLVIGIKEPPIDSIMPEQFHLCFSHTIKGQDYNMPLLQQFIDQKATLLDYELITDKTGKRTIAFGEHAGIAGAVDSLWTAGKKLDLQSKQSPLSKMKQTVNYQTIASLKTALNSIDLDSDESSEPIQVLIIGTGNVGRGAELVCQWLGLTRINADQLLKDQQPVGNWYCVLSSKHINKRLAGGDFNQQEYLEKGKAAYESIIEQLLGRFNVLLQTSYWTDFYPRHLNRQQIIDNAKHLPLVLGDISCDIEGSFICTKIASSIDEPAFTYDALSDSISNGITEDGITVMSIDNLPCELSEDASVHFSSILEGYMKTLMNIDLESTFGDLELIEELKKAVIVYKGELTDNFKYLNEFL